MPAICKNGHRLIEENTYISSNRIRCRLCRNNTALNAMRKKRGTVIKSPVRSFMSMSLVDIIKLVLLILALLCSRSEAQLRSDPINPISSVPWATTAPAQVRTWQMYEGSSIRGKHLGPFVYSGGLHTTSASLTTEEFSTEAFVPERVNQAPASIVYPAEPTDVCWTIISSVQTSITGWVRMGQTAYYVKCDVSSQPLLPANSAWLLYAEISSSAITTVHDLRRLHPSTTRDHIVNVIDYGADPFGINDSTEAFRKALLSPFTNIVIPEGNYTITDELILTRDHCTFRGAGKSTTAINFKPTAPNKTLFLYNAPSNASMFYCGLFGMTIYGGTPGVPFTDYVKTAIQTVHQSEFHLEDVEILFWHDTTFNSIGLHIRGWELYKFDNFSSMADYPVIVDVDTLTTGTLDLDKSSFTRFYGRSAYTYTGGPVTYAPHPCITIRSKVAMFGFKLDGASICASDYGFIDWRETGDAIASSQNIVFESFRWEKLTPTDYGTYAVYVTRTAQQIQSLVIRSLLTGSDGSNGVTLTKCVRCRIEDSEFTRAGGVALAVDNNDHLLLLNNFIQAGATVGFNSQIEVWNWRTDAVNPVSGLYVLSTNIAPYVSMRGFYLGSNVTDPLDNYTIGNWTPTLIGTTTPGTQTYSVQVGKYARVGRLVYVTGTITLATTTGMVGNVIIAGLPANSITGTGISQGVAIGQHSNITLAAGYTQLTGATTSGNSNVQLGQAGSGVPQIAIDASAVIAGTSIAFSSTYLIP
jgi:hypothetical protein